MASSDCHHLIKMAKYDFLWFCVVYPECQDLTRVHFANFFDIESFNHALDPPPKKGCVFVAGCFGVKDPDINHF